MINNKEPQPIDYGEHTGDITRETIEFSNSLRYSEEAISQQYAVKAATFRAEELLLEKIYERLSRPNKTYGEPENDYGRGYVQGWGECMDTLWDIIQEHNENNQWKLRK